MSFSDGGPDSFEHPDPSKDIVKTKSNGSEYIELNDILIVLDYMEEQFKNVYGERSYFYEGIRKNNDRRNYYRICWGS